MQPGMVVCELHSATAFGEPPMVFAQTNAAFTSLFPPLTSLI